MLLRAAIGTLLCGACGQRAVPDPRVTVDRYGALLARGDASAVYELMSENARRYYGPGRVRELMSENRPELQRQARVFSSGRYDVVVQAEVDVEEGPLAELTVEDGEFRIEAEGWLPTRSRSPLALLRDFRTVLRRGSYAGLLRMLSEDTRRAVEAEIASLVDALEEPETLEVTVDGDSATVATPGGHWLELRREGGLWRVHNFQ